MTESLTNMKAVKPMGPKLFIGVAALALVASAGWYFTRTPSGPVGEPEDPTKVLLIGTDDPAAPLLEQMGFSVEQRSLAALSAGDGDDIAAALRQADVEGFGYVAFADASNIDFGSRAVHPDSATISKQHRYAVFSAGDFATPNTKVTVDPNPRRYPLEAPVELLRALFEQDKLAATLVGESKLSIEAQPLFKRIKPAVELKGAYGLVEQRAASTQKRQREYVHEGQEAQPAPRVLSSGMERSRAYGLANGKVLLLVEEPVLVDPLSDAVALTWTGKREAFIYDPETEARTPCEAMEELASGTVSVHAGGATLAVFAERGKGTVFTLDASAPGCGLRKQGRVPTTSFGSWGDANTRGAVVRRVATEDTISAEVVRPGDEHPTVWPLVGCTDTSAPTWVDDTHVAVVCDYRPDLGAEAIEPLPEGEPVPPPIEEQRWLYLLSTEDGSALAYPWQLRAWRPPKLERRPGQSGLELVTDVRDGFERFVFAQDVETLFATPALNPDLPHPPFVPDSSSGVRALSPDAATVSTIKLEEVPSDFTFSPDGAHFAFQVDRVGEAEPNLAVYAFASGKVRRVAINEWVRHESPSFAGPNALVFNSNYSATGRGRATAAQLVTP
jgi:hypothetical protein